MPYSDEEVAAFRSTQQSTLKNGEVDALRARIAELEAWKNEAVVRAIAARDALIPDPSDTQEAYHQLYMLADKFAADPFNPWAEFESIASRAAGR